MSLPGHGWVAQDVAGQGALLRHEVVGLRQLIVHLRDFRASLLEQFLLLVEINHFPGVQSRSLQRV